MTVPLQLRAAETPLVPEEVIQKPSEDVILEAYSKTLTAKAENLVGTKQGQCVIAVRNFLKIGKLEVQGLAKNTTINSHDPEVGAVIVIMLSKYGHVGVVLSVDDEYVYYYDSNGDWTEYAAIRKIKITDKRIRGYHVPYR